VISRNATEQYCVFLSSSISSVIQCYCSMAECCTRNQNCLSGKIRVYSNIRHNLLSTSFTKILFIIGSMLIALHELNSPSCLPGFRIIKICATCFWSRKYPVLILIELHMLVRWTVSCLGISFNILPVIGSYPRDFFGLRSSCIMF
jgi:hypothetical protein